MDTTAWDNSSRPRLLIADDDPMMRSLLSAQLAGDFEVCAVAGDATEAIELAEQNRPDAALVDVEMPGGGGLEAVRQITQRSPDTCIVVLSVDESHDSVVELLNAGAITYIRKGVPGSEITRALTNSIKTRSSS